MANTEQLYQYYLKNSIICTDTRTITEGCLFFALKGENFDANSFAEKAIEKGAAFSIIDNEKYATGDQYILVDDVLTALQDLAKYHRQQLTIPVIGLTGSNGKTTTKELIKAVLQERYTTFATKGNLNNHIGVPLSILSLTKDVEIAVIEMGANHQKEIEMLAEIAQPTHGLITNVGMAHLDGFGGYEGVKKGKAELYNYLAAHHATAFVYENNIDLMDMSRIAKLKNIIYYGKKSPYSIYGDLLKSDHSLEFNWTEHQENFHATANLTGAYNFENILAAITIGRYFDVTPAQINEGLANYFPTNNRSQITKTEHNTIICDFYNANPSSMTAAINNLAGLDAVYKIAILADMFELGTESEIQHDKIGKLASNGEINEVIFIGPNFAKGKERYHGHYFLTVEEAIGYLQHVQYQNAMILVKGSRGMALERLLPSL